MPENKIPGVHIEEIQAGSKPIDGVSTSCAGFVGAAKRDSVPIGEPTLITSWYQFVEKFGRFDKDKAPFLPPAVYGFFSNGGKRCYIVRVKESAEDVDYVGTARGSRSKTGLLALRDIDNVSIICVPGITSNVVQRAMIEQCKEKGNRFCILDPPRKADVVVIKKHRDNLVCEKGFGALYYPWIKVSIETTENDRVKLIQDFVPPSGYIAGVFSRTDREHGVWKAPANVVVRGATDVEFDLPKKVQEELNLTGINCIRDFGEGVIYVWGARTLALDAQWKYVSVRRLCIFIEESIYRGTKWVVFEPNYEPLWARVRANIAQFLISIWKDGALMGTKPEDAFFVQCDRRTMTQNDIENGRLIILVGIAPVKPAEFIFIKISHKVGQVAT